MNILQLTHQYPYPPDKGGRIGIFNFTKYYTQNGNKVFLICMVHQNELVSEELKNYCEEVHLINIDAKDKPLKALLNIFLSSLPYNIEKYYSKLFLNAIEACIIQNKIDIVHVDHLHLAYCGVYIKQKYKIPIVLREHNIEMEIMLRFSEITTNIFEKIYAKLMYRKFLRYEPKMCLEYNQVFCVTERDAAILKKLDKNIKASVSPAGVDLEKYRFVRRKNYTKEKVILSMATLSWKPNIHGLEWFIKEVFPIILKRINGIKFFIGGSGEVAPEFVDLCNESEDVLFKGYVKDDAELIQNSNIFVIPLFAGGGVRIKALNAFACGTPVVSTSIGIEGLAVKNGRECYITDSAEAFANYICDILEHEEIAENMSNNAYQFVSEIFSWKSIVDKQIKQMEILVNNNKKY